MSKRSSGRSRSSRMNVEQALDAHDDGQLAAIADDGLERIAARGLDRAGQCFECRGHQRAIVLVRQILFCSWRIPYSSASDVGGQPGT